MGRGLISSVFGVRWGSLRSFVVGSVGGGVKFWPRVCLMLNNFSESRTKVCVFRALGKKLICLTD